MDPVLSTAPHDPSVADTSRRRRRSSNLDVPRGEEPRILLSNKSAYRVSYTVLREDNTTISTGRRDTKGLRRRAVEAGILGGGASADVNRTKGDIIETEEEKKDYLVRDHHMQPMGRGGHFELRLPADCQELRVCAFFEERGKWKPFKHELYSVAKGKRDLFVTTLDSDISPHSEPRSNAAMDKIERDVSDLLRLEDELNALPRGVERDAKVHLLKYLQAKVVHEYQRRFIDLYFNLRRDEGFRELRRIQEKEQPESGLVQPVESGSIEDYLLQAELAKLCLDELLELVAFPGTPGREVISWPVRSLDSTRRKANECGGIRHVTDLARATVICDTPQDLADVFELVNLMVRQGGDILRVSNDFIHDYTSNGYRDVKVNVIAAEHICEIQLHLRSFYALKDGQDKVYEWSRTLDVAVDKPRRHLFKNLETGTLQLMIRLSRENWRSTYTALPSLLVESGDYEEARALLRKGVDGCEKERLQVKLAHGEDSKEWNRVVMDLAIALWNLALVLVEEGKYDEAEPLYVRAIKIVEKALVPDYLQLGSLLNNWAMSLTAQGKSAEADPVYIRAIEIGTKTLGPEHPTLATWLSDREGHIAEAAALGEKAIEIAKKSLGPVRVPLGSSLNDRALSLKAQGHIAEGAAFSEKALEIAKKSLGPVRVPLGSSLNDRAMALKAQVSMRWVPSPTETTGKGQAMDGEQSTAQGQTPSNEPDRVSEGESGRMEPHSLGVPDSSDSNGVGLEVAASVPQATTAPATIHLAQNVGAPVVDHKGAGGEDVAAASSKDGVLAQDVDGRTRPASKWGGFSVRGQTRDVSSSGDIIDFDIMRDAFGFVEVKVAHEESALMNDVKLINRVYTEEISVRGEQDTYFIDPVVEGPHGVELSEASIRYFVGRYEGLLVKFNRAQEGTSDKEHEKGEIGSLAVQQYFPLQKPDSREGDVNLPWKADGEFEAVWDGDELWLETPLTHFSKRGRGWRWRRPKTPPPSPAGWVEDAMEFGLIEAAEDVVTSRLIRLVNNTKQTVRTCITPDANPDEQAAKKKGAGGGFTILGYGLNANRNKEASYQHGAMGGAGNATLGAQHNNLGPGQSCNDALGGKGHGGVVWYTVDDFTPDDLKSRKFEQVQLQGGHTPPAQAQTHAGHSPLAQSPTQSGHTPLAQAQAQSEKTLVCGFTLARLEVKHG